MQEFMPFFTSQQLAVIDPSKKPWHVAIIPDGNRRWAQSRQLETVEGHRHGADVLMNIIYAAKELDIGMITIYGFSTENWQRPRNEVEVVLWLIQSYLQEQCPKMVEHGIRFLALGDIGALPDSLQMILKDAQQATSHCNGITLALALNYSGRSELCRACQRLLDDCADGKLKEQRVDEQLLSRYLDTWGFPDPDLLIRPGGEQRLSNFLLWQLSYTELHFSPKMWPEFGPQDLYDAVIAFQQRQRRLGA